MTVQELIEKLQGLPADLPVVTAGWGMLGPAGNTVRGAAVITTGPFYPYLAGTFRYVELGTAPTYGGKP